MARILVHDLVAEKALDRQAMVRVKGGYAGKRRRPPSLVAGSERSGSESTKSGPEPSTDNAPRR